MFQKVFVRKYYHLNINIIFITPVVFRGALRCIFTTDELKKGVPSPAGSLSRNKDLLDQNKLNVIFGTLVNLIIVLIPQRL